MVTARIEPRDPLALGASILPHDHRAVDDQFNILLHSMHPDHDPNEGCSEIYPKNHDTHYCECIKSMCLLSR